MAPQPLRSPRRTLQTSVALVLLFVPLTQALPIQTEPAADVWIEPAAQDALDKGGSVTLLLGFDGNPDAAALAPLHTRGLPVWRAEHLPAAAVVATAADLDAILGLPGLRSVAHDEALEWAQVPEAAPGNLGGTGDALSRSDRARALGVDGSGVTIAVVDTGIDGTHPALRPAELGGPLRNNVWFLAGEGGGVGGGTPTAPASVHLEHQLDTDPADGHGSHVASTAAGDPTRDGHLGGRAPGAGLVGCSIGEAVTVYWGLACFDWILGNHQEHDIRIVSNSWGSPGPWMPLHPINLATKALDEAGLLVLFAAGNSGPEPDTLIKYARAPWVIGVGSTSLAGDVSPFSSRGLELRDTGPDLMAPGHNIVGARSKPLSAMDSSLATAYYDAAFIEQEHLPRYRTSSGTSMATPQVAGIAALVLEANPQLSPAEVRQVLYETARPIAGASYADAGHGLVDAEAAVQRALGGSTGNPDWVDATEVEVGPDTITYRFHGALVGGPIEDWNTFTQRMPVLVRTPADGLDLRLEWQPPVTPNPLAAATNVRFTVTGPDGYEAHAEGLGSRTDAPGELTLHINGTTLAAHNKVGWSAGYWTATAAALSGAVELDLTATIHYEDGVIPSIGSDLPPPPPPPELVYQSREPIVIATDEDFTSENGVTAGSGTAGDPYIIEGWDLTSPGSPPALHIGGPIGTTAHVVVRNLHAHASTQSCIQLENAHNVEIVGIEVDSCAWGIYIGGGSTDVTVRDSEIHHAERALGVYGSERVTISGNHMHDFVHAGITAAQGAAGGGNRFPLSADVQIVDNVLANGAHITLISPAVLDWTLRDNEMTRSAMIFSGGTAGHKVSGMNWTSGITSYQHEALGLGTPGYPANTIVDAGSQPRVAADGTTCFDARVVAAPPLVVEEVSWDFGDGTQLLGVTDPCHTYDDPEDTYVATIVVTARSPTGEADVLQDDVWVNP